jgi:hypothetical protein
LHLKQQRVDGLRATLAQAEHELAELRRVSQASWPTFKYKNDSITYQYDPEQHRFGSDFSGFSGHDDVSRMMRAYDVVRVNTDIGGFFVALLSDRYRALYEWAHACRGTAP